MVGNNESEIIQLNDVHGYRLINSKYPPIDLFDDVASEAEFAAIFEIQSITNPRLRAQAGNLSLLPTDQIPFGIRGCSYAVGAFTHVNPSGSRFSDGTYGVMYIADDVKTALAEVSYHQNKYFQNVVGLKFERFVFRLLSCKFDADTCSDLTGKPLTDPIYHPDSYSESQAVGRRLRSDGIEAVQYHSVRNKSGDAMCWGLFTPKNVTEVLQSAHYEMVWDSSSITAIAKLSR
jgi:hypothetical protein